MDYNFFHFIFGYLAYGGAVEILLLFYRENLNFFKIIGIIVIENEGMPP